MQHLVGVDLGGTNLRCALFDGERHMLSRMSCPTAASEGPDAVIGRIAAGIDKAIAESGVPRGDVAAVGVGVPGPLNQEQGLVSSTPNMPGWENIELGRELSLRTNIATFIENDANCAGWGEFVAGAGVGCKHMVMVTLGTGIGGAIILDGKLHIGRDGAAGELGHMCVMDGGRRCGCGALGCIEAYASATAVVKRFVALIDDGWHSPLAAKRASLTSRDIFEAAETGGDPVAMRIVEETGHYLGVMASSIAELINPVRSIVSGGMIQAGETLFTAIRQTCLNRNHHPARTMEIVPAALGADAGLVGAADYAAHCLQTKERFGYLANLRQPEAVRV